MNEKNSYLNNDSNKEYNSIMAKKKPLTLKMDETSKSFNRKLSSQKKIKNNKFPEIENIIKNVNKISLKKYSTNNLEKKINYSKYKSSQKNQENNIQLTNNNNNYNNIIKSKISKLSLDNDLSKSHPTGISTQENIEKDNIKQKSNLDINNNINNVPKKNKSKIYEEIIKKNMPFNNNKVYHKYTNRNMCFSLKKNNNANDKTIKSPLESLRSKGSILFNNKLNYDKFKNVFLIINDTLSIMTNTVLKNTNNNFIKFLAFLDNNEILNLVKLNREMRSCIIGCLAYKVKEKILPDFTSFYCKDIIFNNDYNFMISSKVYKKNKLIIRFILSIKPRISNVNKNIINKRFKIGFSENVKNKYNYLSNISKENNEKEKKSKKEKIYTTYVFDIINKNTPKNFWVFKENTSFHYDENEKAYYNNIMQLKPNDNALINMSLISEVGVIDFNNIFWFKPKIENIKESLLNKCEVERMIHEWNKIELLSNGEIVKNNLEQLFGDNFIINEINYDDVGYFFFKVILKAYKVGICYNLGIKIHILPINSCITNEIKKNGLIFDENNELSINVGDKITFYISQNK